MMPRRLELHVQGPVADLLPSFSPGCLAAIAYVGQALPRDRWVLIAGDFDFALRADELPALRDGDTCVWGFDRIVEYLREQGGRRRPRRQPPRGEGEGGREDDDGDDDNSGDELGVDWDLDAGLSRQDKADCVAFSSLISANGQALLDLSLYVSSRNYETVTRPLLSTIIPWPLQYLYAPQLRAAAKVRTEHLGLSSLDIDNSTTSESTSHSIIPESLQVRPKETVTTAVSQAQHSTQFRLGALVTTFLTPIQDLLGDKKYLLPSTTGPSSLDCLALGYLSLALDLFLPQPWLANTMRLKFPTLCTYVNRLRKECFESSHENATTTSSTSSQLPWKQPEQRPNRAAKTTSVVLTHLANSLPLVRYLTTNPGHHPTTTTLPHSNNNVALALAAGASVSAVVGYLLFSGAALPFPTSSASPPPQQRRNHKGADPSLREMGEAGAILAGGFFELDNDADRAHHHMPIREDLETANPGTGTGTGPGIPIVELDIDVDVQGETPENR